MAIEVSQEKVKRVVPQQGLIITESVIFEPGEYEFSEGLGIVISNHNVSIDGTGVKIKGPGIPGKKHLYIGVGIYSNGYSNIEIKNITIEGFKLGCKIMNASNCMIHHNDFSNNYTDPDYGWGDGEPDGALMLVNVTNSTVSENKGNNTWNGLNLQNSNGNFIRNNTFSHCSNVCLKMWGSSRNLIEDNIMNYGIRIAPEEVHARDSTSVLIEAGSNYNKFYRNDFTYGGDGVFIRSLNHYVSVGNYFEENDASYAHNNAWEIWDPGNILVNNKGNHSSYGFWLGGSDHCVFIGNEAAYNGIRKSNAPESFGNAGVAVVNGSSSHFVMKNNYIHHNKGVGAAVRFKEKNESYHWIVQQNRIEDNETYGIYLNHVHWMDIAGNAMKNNKLGDIKHDDNVKNVTLREATMEDTPPVAAVTVSSKQIHAGELLLFDASNSKGESPLSYYWELGDGTVSEEAAFEHAYQKAGFYKVGLTVHDGKLADLAWLDIYVLEKGKELGKKESSSENGWKVNVSPADSAVLISADRKNKLESEHSLKVRTNAACLECVLYKGNDEDWEFDRKEKLSFWIKTDQEVRDSLMDHVNPVICLGQDEQNYFLYSLKNSKNVWSENRDGWVFVEFQINGDESHHFCTIGNPKMKQINYIKILTYAQEGYFTWWIDSLKVL